MSKVYKIDKLSDIISKYNYIGSAIEMLKTPQFNYKDIIDKEWYFLCKFTCSFLLKIFIYIYFTKKNN